VIGSVRRAPGAAGLALLVSLLGSVGPSRDQPSSQPKAALRGLHILYTLEHLKTRNASWDLRAKALLAVA
jgi:hypothetical protein